MLVRFVSEFLTRNNEATLLEGIMKSVADIIYPLCTKFKSSLLNKAVCVFTPFSEKKSVSQLHLSAEAKDFIAQYEPKALSDGLFLHQYHLLDAYSGGAKNFILTSSTGSGKSLCFWTWIMDVLAKNHSATALACFPTQALMWGQAERLAKISEPTSLTIRDYKTGIAYSGKIRIGSQEIGWTVWKGTGGSYTKDQYMDAHESSAEFINARIRIATLDKAHYSLISKYPEFTLNLECMVLDEAHQYDGIFGANVAYFLKRIYVAKTSAGKPIPNMFLASATLADAKAFASKLLSLPEKIIYHEKDAIQSQVKSIKIEDVDRLLLHPPGGGLLRVVLFNDILIDKSHFAEVIDNEKIIGTTLNLLYFTDAKFASRLKKRELDIKKGQRIPLIYDADLPPQERRRVEGQFNKGTIRGATLIATSALELGVDIENLDICILQSVPPKRADMLQRIGRVGRRQDKPGLILISLSASPLDRYIAENVESAFCFDNTKSIPIPTELEIIKLKNIAAIQSEMKWWKQKGQFKSPYCSDWNVYKEKLDLFFGDSLNMREARDRLQDKYGQLIDTTGRYWMHGGFRASAAQSKIPLRVINTKNDDVAWIEDINVFRDAHPEAVYLDDKGKRWRIVSYDGKWKEAEWEHPESTVILAKYLKSIEVVYVKEEPNQVATRGIWEETFEPYQLFSEPPEGVVFPGNGDIEYGIWEYARKFNGYKQIYFSNKATIKVSLTEVSARFKDAMGSGNKSPFLFPLTYRTYGWSWDFGEAVKKYELEFLESIENLTRAIVVPFIADAIQSSPNDIQVDLSLSAGTIKILDATPGGNGLAEGLLRCDGIPLALQNCKNILMQFIGKDNQGKFRHYVMSLCQEDAKHDAEQIIDIIDKLQSYWSR